MSEEKQNEPKKPTSQKKIEANRRNAQKSTGPKTTAGKAKSSMNAVKHGLTSRPTVLPEEDTEAYREHWIKVAEQFDAKTYLETLLVRRIALLTWRQARIAEMECHLFERFRYDMLGRDRGIGAAFELAGRHGENDFNKLARYEAHLERGLSRALKELKSLQMERLAEEQAQAEAEAEQAERRYLVELASGGWPAPPAPPAGGHRGPEIWVGAQAAPPCPPAPGMGLGILKGQTKPMGSNGNQIETSGINPKPQSLSGPV